MANRDYLCGNSFWHPKWMQRFATSKMYLAIYGLLGTIQSMSHMYIIVTLTTMEKRFKMPSQTTGIILSGNEISQILLSVILSYYGGKRNRPLWISWGITFCALSCFIIALPHFIYGAGHDALELTAEYFYEIEQSEDNERIVDNENNNISYNKMVNYYQAESLNTMQSKHDQTLCHLNNMPSLKLSSLLESQGNEFWSSHNSSLRISRSLNELKCSNKELMTYIVPLVLVFLSQFVLGIGNSLYYALGQTYLDDNTSKKKTPLMLAFAMTLRMIGPIIGFFLGYGSLSLYIDSKRTPLINKHDPRWLGAWWFGWIILGIVMLIFAFLMGLFPKTMSKYDKNCDELVDLTAKGKCIEKKCCKIKDLNDQKDFQTTLLKLIKNKLLMCNILSGTFYLLGALGYMTFLAKIMEVQFFKSRRDSTIVIGPMIVTGIVIGFLISGFIISKKKPSASKLLTWNIIVGILHICFITSHLFIYCDNPLTLGVGKSLSWTTKCNTQCQCYEKDVPYSPVCDKSTGVSYYSPCHAGCQYWNSSTNTYLNCICLRSNHGLDNSSYSEHHLTTGICLKNCNFSFISFAILSMISNVFISTGKINNILISFRAIAPEDKSIAQGLTLMLVSLLASIPGPILYGRIIDMTCLKWNIKCRKYLNCQLYDQTKFRYYVNLTGLGLTLIGVIFDVFVWHYGKNLKLYNETETENPKDDHDKGDKKIYCCMKT